jgi:hypothetical protein
MATTLEQMNSFLNELADHSQLLGRNFEAPKFLEVNGMPQFRHREKNDLLMSYLKCIRAISSLNAATVLLRFGYVQEIGALCRCVDEFCEDVLFLATPLGEEDEYSKTQQRLVEEYFQEEFEENAGAILKPAPRARVPREKIQAGIARIKGHPINPHDAKQMHRTLGKTFSGYIHGAYPHTMEMYGGLTFDQCAFHVFGMLETPRISEWTETLANYVYRTAMCLEVVAKRCEDNEVERLLRESRSNFEKHTGLGKDDANELLKKIKKK